MGRSIFATVALGFMSFVVLAQEWPGKVEFENELVRVSRRRVEPALDPRPTPKCPPALLVFLADYSVRLTTAARQEELRGKPGEFLWHAGGRISLRNLSEHRVEVAQDCAEVRSHTRRCVKRAEESSEH